MKKSLVALLCLLLTIGAQAQDKTTIKKPKKEKKIKLVEEETEPLRAKNGQLIVPQAGSFGVGVNVVPFFHWAGNFFNANGNNLFASSGRLFDRLGSSVIMGRYFVNNTTTTRVALGFRVTNITETNYVNRDGFLGSDDETADTRTIGQGNYVLSLGYEKRVGKKRLRGYYGVDFLFGFRNDGAYIYTYGNSYRVSNPTPTTTNWGGNFWGGNTRVLSQNTRVTWSVGVRPFLGVEYFFAPRLSVGAEFGGTLVYSGTIRSNRIVEVYTLGDASSSTEEESIGGNGSFNAYLDTMGGAIFMNVYF
ncbi:MAG: hypothetical protein ACRBFS_23700 [Aureispira sp.]